LSFDEIGEELDHFFNGGPRPQKRPSGLTKPYFQKQPKRRIEEQPILRFPPVPQLSLQDKVSRELYQKEIAHTEHNYYLTIHLGTKTYLKLDDSLRENHSTVSIDNFR